MTTEQDPTEGAGWAFHNLADLVGRNAVQRPDAVALVDVVGPRRSIAWAALDAQIDRVAAGLAARGLVAPHRVALCGPNSLEWVIAYFAALRAGFVVVPINPQSSPDEMSNMITDSGARLALTADGRGMAGIDTVALTADGLADLCSDGHVAVESPQDVEALAVLLYTAGTSGDPKAAMLSHRALLAHLEQVSGLEVVAAEDVVLGSLPLFHVFGLSSVLGAAVAAGAKIVLAEGLDATTPAMIRDEGVTNLPLAPSALYRLLQLPDLAESVQSVRMVLSGAAPLPVRLAADFTETTGLRVERGYGLTEAAPGVASTCGGEVLGAGHVGRALPGVEVRIGDGVDEGEPGEIWIRGDNVFSGYWPDGHDGPDAGGWFATGDVGYRADGEMFLVDRARDLIIVSGFNVYPAEIEYAISEIEGVRSVAVLGTPFESSGERVVAFVEADGVDEERIMEHCRTRLARFKQPSLVYLVPQLPRGATGKIRKGALRRSLEAPDDE